LNAPGRASLTSLNAGTGAVHFGDSDHFNAVKQQQRKDRNEKIESKTGVEVRSKEVYEVEAWIKRSELFGPLFRNQDA